VTVPTHSPGNLRVSETETYPDVAFGTRRTSVGKALTSPTTSKLP